MKAAFHTLGCKVNQCDTQAMMECFLRAGHELVGFEDQADCYIINTCTVTAVSDKKSRQMIARAHARQPAALVVVAGCLAQRDAQAALALPGVQLAVGNAERGRIVELVEAARSGQEHNAVAAWTSDVRFEELPAYAEGKTRAMLKIQEGCNRYCSYCIIPYARGPLRSRSLPDILAEGARLAGQGFQEFVLTGIHLSSYQGARGEELLDVVAALAQLEGVARIRLGSLEPVSITPAFAQAAANIPALCQQFHLSLQSGCDATLRRMNRRYTTDQFAQSVQQLRQHMPGLALTTDIIVGFPGETEEDFVVSREFVRQMAFSRIHVFPFSPRQGTPAASMPHPCAKPTKTRRAADMIALGEELSRGYRQGLLGSVQQVLFEQETSNGGMQGLTDSYIQVSVPQKQPPNHLLPVRLLALQGEGMQGVVLNP